MTTYIQPSFARGEISDDLYGRVDTEAYDAAVRRARNMIVHAHGGISNRPGLQYIASVKTHSVQPVLVEFRFKTTDTYILEFGNLYMRVIRNDALVLETATTITGATSANPVVVTDTGHLYADGDEVYISGVVGMTEINNLHFTVANKTANTFELTDQVTGANIDGSAYTTYSSAGTAEKIFELTTTYATADLAKLNFTQSADTMTIAHPTYPISELTRTDHDAWALTEPTFAPDQTYPTGVSVTADTTGAVTERYQVTAIAEDDLEESLPGVSTTTTASASATAANPVVVTAAGHPYINGDEVEISGYTEMTEVNGRRFVVANKATNTFELEGEDGTGYAAETTGGSVNATFFEITNGAATKDNTITWTEVTGAQRYAIYYRDNGVYGIVGESELATFTDDNISADLSVSPPRAKNPFLGSTNYPGAVSYFEQRRVFGGSTNKPDTAYYSRAGNHANFSISTPGQADDGITATLTSREVNEIRHFVPGNDLLIFTSGSEWRVNSGSDVAFSADNLKQKPQSRWGASNTPPIVVGNVTLFVQENKSTVRSLGYSLQIDGYTGTDMTLFASHLFTDKTIEGAAFARYPDPIIHYVRSDGELCTFTFQQEQKVIAWSTWDTDGDFEAVAATRPASTDIDDAAYFVIKRTINGNTVRYIERTHSRRFEDVQDCFFVDSGLSLDTPLTITGATAADPVVVTATAHGFSDGDDVDISDIIWTASLDSDGNATQPDQLNGRRFTVNNKNTNDFELLNSVGKNVTGVTKANPAVVSSAGHGFSDGDVVHFSGVLGMTTLNGNTYTVANKTDDTFELSGTDSSAYGAWTGQGLIKLQIDGTAFDAYVEGGAARQATTSITGLTHLIGETVQVLANGNVISDQTVSATGTLTLTTPASRVHIGLRYISDIQTLNVESPQGTIQGKDKMIPKVTVRFKKSRGLLVGPNTDELTEMKQREFEDMGEPTALLTGDKEIDLNPIWQKDGRLWLRQLYPLPMTILAIIPDVTVQ